MAATNIDNRQPISYGGRSQEEDTHQYSVGDYLYLAGSIIMVLSSLTVVGTLISDLLLAWADPRIRFEA